MISVVIRNKNEEEALSFLLKNLRERYPVDVDEIIVLDNLSTDGSEKACKLYNARFVTIEEFSYGGSANIAASEATHDIVVIFSAHSYPVSHDFFKLIKEKFEGREEDLAGLRCLHNSGDYLNYLNDISSTVDPNRSGLMFAGSAFNKKIWKKHPFKSNVRTFEDKEWTVRVIKEGYKIEMVPSIFCYHVNRTRRQMFFRFKNDTVGTFQLFRTKSTLKQVLNNFGFTLFDLHRNFAQDIYYSFLRFIFMVKFLSKKQKKF